jgi:hypothetical protein
VDDASRTSMLLTAMPKNRETIRTWLGVFRELLTISDHAFFCGHVRQERAPLDCGALRQVAGRQTRVMITCLASYPSS